MPASPLPLNEPQRLAALCSYDVLDTAPEEGFDDLTSLAAELCDAPMAVVSLVDTDRQWFKSRVGLGVSETPRDQAFCAYALHSDQPLIVEDATRDPRFVDNPLVTGEMHLRFYAGVPLINEDGLTLGTLCVMGTEPRSLSEGQRKSLERLGRQAVALLELRRTAARMTEARERADGANRAKDAFIAMVSHEFRTPLHGILSFANFGLKNAETATPDKLNGYFERIASSGQRLLLIVNDLLDLSKLEAGEMSYVFKREALGPIIDATVDECRSLADERGLDVRVAHPAGALWVEADRGRLMQAVRNLLGNALKFTPDHGRIELCVSPTEAGATRITVTDSGPGIPEAELAGVFGRFVQASSTAAVGGGTGLGLAICEQIVRAHRGRVWAENAENRGARFIIELDPPDTGRNAEAA